VFFYFFLKKEQMERKTNKINLTGRLQKATTMTNPNTHFKISPVAKRKRKKSETTGIWDINPAARTATT
jgi:hypothetical protein